MTTRDRRSLFVLALCSCLALPSATTFAQQSPAEQHSGVYLRMSVGLTSMQVPDGSGDDSELGGTLSFALGYFILPKLALSLDVFGANAYKFHLQPEGEDTTLEIDARTLAAGVSLTYYLPYQFYVSVAPGVGWLRVTAPDADSHISHAAFALDAIAGKEWWIGGSWALGVGAQLVYVLADIESAGIDHSWALGVLFTVTRN